MKKYASLLVLLLGSCALGPGHFVQTPEQPVHWPPDSGQQREPTRSPQSVVLLQLPHTEGSRRSLQIDSFGIGNPTGLGSLVTGILFL